MPRTGQPRPSPPVQASVYEQDGSNEIATVKPVAPSYWTFIDKSGNVSTPATMSDFDSRAVPEQDLPIPCDALSAILAAAAVTRGERSRPDRMPLSAACLRDSRSTGRTHQGPNRTKQP